MASKVSDEQDVSFGVRKITYSVPGTDTLTISVNGVPVFIRGGDWGLDEALKRIPRERLEAQIRMHQLANMNLIRNWVGQSTGEDFYELCDKYGILCGTNSSSPIPATAPIPPTSTPISPTCATRFCASATIPRSACGARATRAFRRRRSTLPCAS